MSDYNEAVQWLHDNPLKHCRVKLRGGGTAIAFHSMLERERPIVAQSEEANRIHWCKLDGSHISIAREDALDIIGFPDPEPEVWYRPTDPNSSYLCSVREFERKTKSGRAFYERVHVTPAPLDGGEV